MLILTFNFIHSWGNSLVHLCGIHHFFEYHLKTSWVRHCHGLNWRCHHGLHGVTLQLHFGLVIHSDLTAYLDFPGGLPHFLQSFWGASPLIISSGRTFSCNFALMGSLTTRETFSLRVGRHFCCQWLCICCQWLCYTSLCHLAHHFENFSFLFLFLLFVILKLQMDF